MSTSTNDDPNKPVTGYPYPPPPPQSTYNNNNNQPPNGYPPPPAQSSTIPGRYPYTAPPPAAYYTNPNHPYPAPPPPNYYYGAAATPNPRANFLRRMLILMIALFIIFGALTFIFWLIFRPHYPEFRVQSASVTGFNATGTQLAGDWDFTFFVRNPNKRMDISYRRIEGSVFYRREFLTTTVIAPFAQGTKNDTTVKAKFGASGTYVDGELISQINGDRSRGRVDFNVRLGGWVRFSSNGWKTRTHDFRVYCDAITIEFTGNSGVGTLTGGPRRCVVDI